MTTPSPSRARLLAACAVDSAIADAPLLAAWLFGEAAYEDPDDGELRAARIACLLDGEQAEAALRELEDPVSAAAIIPKRSVLHAAALLEVRRAGDALPLARLAAAEYPSDVQSQLVLAQAEMEHGHLDAAAAAADEAVRLANVLPQPHALRAQIAMQRDRREEAIVSLRRAVALAPDDPDLRTALATALLDAGDREEAQRHLIQVVSNFPHHADGERALLSSQMAVRPGPPRALLVALGTLPLVGGAIGLLIGFVTWADVWNALWSGLITGLAIQQIGFLFLRRRRTSPEVAEWMRHVRRRMHRRTTTPVLRLLPAVSLVGLLVSFLLVFLTLPEAPLSERLGGTVFLFCCYMLLALVILGSRSRARHAAPPAAPPAAVDTSVCNCVHVSRLEGAEAERYATNHLRSSGGGLTRGVGILECPVMATPWLWFSEDIPVEHQALPALVRVTQSALHPEDD